MDGVPETNDQFLARMLIHTREGDQLTSRDAKKLNDLAVHGRQVSALGQPTTSTMPEERRDASLQPGDAERI